MNPKRINIRLELDKETDLELTQWSEAEGRSKRRHAGILLRRMTHLRKTNPAELARILGLLDGTTHHAA